MFSFHKPKVYRSSTGCCICKAKSSSSRFTDSKKYEEDFIKCFQLEERRTGEICNACVLLVKRWKKLPAGSSRNWRHVVDARAGPGIKSLTKFKAKNKKKAKEIPEKFEKILKKKHIYVKNNGDREQSPAMSDDLTEEDVAGTGSKGSSRANSPAGSDDTVVGEKRLDIDQSELDISGFIDLTYFKRKNVCCGVIFLGMLGEVMIEPSLFKPCMNCLARQQRERTASVSLSLVAGSSPTHSTSSASASPCHSSASTSPAHSVESSTDGSVKSMGKGFCDSFSDSGYDDSSNQSSILSENKKMHHQQPPPPPPAQSLHLLTKPGKPIKKVQIEKLEKSPIASSPARLRTGGTKMPIKLLCKPVAIVSSTKLSLSNSTSRPVETVLKTVSAAHEFAVRPPPHRQSLAN